VHVRDVKTGKVNVTLSPDRGGVDKVAFSPNGKQLAGVGGYPVSVKGGFISVGELRVWEIGPGKVQFKITDLPGQLTAVAFSPNGKTLATGSSGPIREKGLNKWVSSEVRLWDVSTGALTYSIEGKLGSVFSLAFSPDGGTIVWSDQEQVTVTEASTGSQRGTLMKVMRHFEQQ
jgi:WD40 repeat protein